MSIENQKYVPAGSVLQSFHWSESFVRLIMGPIGSGKSYACCYELFALACAQEPDSHGVRRSRFAIIRDSYPNLRDTSLKTFLDIFPEHTFGPVHRQSPMRAHHKFKMRDGTSVDAEYIFLSIDHEEDEAKLMSLELSGAFLNEARYLNESVLKKLLGRVGRYPSKKMGGCTHPCIVLDTNPPDVTHWIYKKFVTEPVATWAFFQQPSGVGPDAENLHNLPANYYQNVIDGETEAGINAYVHGQFSYSDSEAPVHEKFSATANVRTGLVPRPYLKTYVGCDFGRTPAALFIQHDPQANQWIVLHEICLFPGVATDLAEAIKQLVATEYQGMHISYWGDPSGGYGSQTTEDTVFDIMNAEGIKILPAGKNNNWDIRKGVMDHVLNQKAATGGECLLVDATCTTFIAGMSGAYHYKKSQNSNKMKYSEMPDKTDESHIVEAGHYGLIGAGLDRVIVTAEGERNKTYRKPKVITSSGRTTRGATGTRQDW